MVIRLSSDALPDQENVTPAPTHVTADSKALGEAAKLIQAASTLEETRFNNLNTRAVAVVSASSIVTGLAGVFSKDLLTTNLGTGFPRVAVALGLTVSVLALVGSAATMVIKVLLPNRRAAFGNNALTACPETLTTDALVFQLTLDEYREVFVSLQARNAAKAKALKVGYLFFLAAIAFIAAATCVVAIAKIDGN